MDIPRPERVRRHKHLKVATFIVIACAFVGLGFIAINVSNSPVRVSRETFWFGKVERGRFQVEVRGVGKLEPYDTSWVSAESSGKVDEIFAFSGENVEEDSVLLKLTNPELKKKCYQAKLEYEVALASFARFQKEQECLILEKESDLDILNADMKLADSEAAAVQVLHKKGMVTDFNLRKAQMKAEQCGIRHKSRIRELSLQKEVTESRVHEEEVKVAQIEANYLLLKDQVEALHVKAGSNGVLKKVLFERGQQIRQGDALAQVSDPSRLRAVVGVSEMRAKEMQEGLLVWIDTPYETLEGIVEKVIPTIENGMVKLYVRLLDELPQGVRPDMSVDATVVLSRLENCLFVDRPVGAIAMGEAFVYRLDEEGRMATKTSVSFGRSSSSQIQILSGLQEGQPIVLSDMSEWSDQPVLQLK